VSSRPAWSSRAACCHPGHLRWGSIWTTLTRCCPAFCSVRVCMRASLRACAHACLCVNPQSARAQPSLFLSPLLANTGTSMTSGTSSPHSRVRFWSAVIGVCVFSTLLWGCLFWIVRLKNHTPPAYTARMSIPQPRTQSIGDGASISSRDDGDEDRASKGSSFQ
jgi:hypothetical protein